jgi:trigger factor
MTLRELKERRLPALDDEFAHSVGEYATLDELKARLREGLQAQAASEAEAKVAARVLDQVAKGSKIEYPNLAVEQEIDRMIRQRENRLRQQGFTLESFLRTAHKSIAQLRDEMRAEAEEGLRRSLVLTEVARAEKIEVTPEELASEVDRLAASFGEQAEAVRQAFTREGALAPVLSDLYTRKSLTRLVDVVTGKVEGACRVKPGEEAEARAGEAPAQPSAEEQKP